MDDEGTEERKPTGTKERILRVALELLEQEGATALKIRAIAERASVSVSVVTHHFVNKQGLLDACKDWYYKGLGEVVRDVIATSQDGPMTQLIELAIRETFRYSRAHMAVLRMLTRDVFADGGLIEPYQGVGERPHFNPVMDGFAPRLGLSPRRARVRLQAVSVVLTRFSTASDAELDSIFGAHGDEAVQSAEDHVVEIASLLLSAGKDDN